MSGSTPCQYCCLFQIPGGLDQSSGLETEVTSLGFGQEASSFGRLPYLIYHSCPFKFSSEGNSPFNMVYPLVHLPI